MQSAQEFIADHAAKGDASRKEFFATQSKDLEQAAFKTAIAIARGNKLLLCGNGGSAADAQHIAGEFVNKFLIDRPALPAIALTTDTSVLTAIGNDTSYEMVFSRQIEALGSPGDALFAISTSGNSPNVINAIETALAKDMFVIGLTGPKGGLMTGRCDILLKTPGPGTPVIQETHLAAEHVFCALVDYFLFENVAAIAPYLDSSSPSAANKDK